ncbi:hypothetical protein CEP51_014991 [Fusarium floridanum]|uniref:Uncharacterized protein n=1 Tax=Fusarium floridanum TaxID=1325733 RepID=A0A428PIC5_9HYPO|nr:hypothetical protein CEP51_014991 [Fusarium floridanum]
MPRRSTRLNPQVRDTVDTNPHLNGILKILTNLIDFLRNNPRLAGLIGVLAMLGFLVHNVDDSSVMPIPEAVNDRAVVGPLREICHLHYRMHSYDPTREPQTFFDVLGISMMKDERWLHKGTRAHNEAVDLILKSWGTRKKELMDGGRPSQEERHLDQVAKKLTDVKYARIYVHLVMPKIQWKRGPQRLTAFKTLCDNEWRDPFE